LTLTLKIMTLDVYSCHLLKAQVVALIWSLIQAKYEPFSKEVSNTIVLFGFLVGTPFIVTCYISDYVAKGL
jgi:hypothetical protein